MSFLGTFCRIQENRAEKKCHSDRQTIISFRKSPSAYTRGSVWFLLLRYMAGVRLPGVTHLMALCASRPNLRQLIQMQKIDAPF